MMKLTEKNVWRFIGVIASGYSRSESQKKKFNMTKLGLIEIGTSNLLLRYATIRVSWTSFADRGLYGDMATLIDVAPQNRWINLQRLVCVIFTTAGVLNGCLIASMNLYLKNKISLIDESSTDLKSEVSLNEIIRKFDTFMILGCSIMLFSAYGSGCHTEFQSKWPLKWMIYSRNWPFSLSFLKVLACKIVGGREFTWATLMKACLQQFMENGYLC